MFGVTGLKGSHSNQLALWLGTVLVELPDDLDARIALSDALLHLRRFDDGLRVLDAPPLALQSGTGTGTGTAPWWESARARMMRAKFQLAQGGTDAFLDAALPLVEETIEGEHQARQRRALEARQPTSKRGSDARNLDGQNPADVFAGYTPTQPRKKQKTRREKAAEKAAAEAAAQGGEEPGVNGPQGTAEGGGVNVPPTGDAASREEDALEEAADADVGREGEDDRADVSGEGGAADADVIGATPGSRGDEADGANALAEPPGAEPAVLIPDVFTSGESFELLFEVVKGLADTGRLKKAAGIVQRVMLLAKNAPPGKRLSGEQRRVLKQLTAGVEYTERPTGERERDTLRNKCKEEPDNMALWNELNEKATRSGGYLPYRKWLFQLRVKHPGSVPVAMLCGHQYASSQKHASALREYARAHAQLPDEPLISLSIGLAFLHHAMNRRTSHRNRAVLQGFAFLYKYHRLAGGSQLQPVPFQAALDGSRLQPGQGLPPDGLGAPCCALLRKGPVSRPARGKAWRTAGGRTGCGRRTGPGGCGQRGRAEFGRPRR
ncbi:hypothetical protein KFL_004070010 [Klebsormidium nitens]|uniref:Uncharacterized protein n=1 Tax=Klebsormidium nitens TaxID=105231 RepID=A0A1Y1IFD4_KLENI|nr:hypothetical protein KFL_004070010 [Klebsormidium nitens]|eukprot:GAQ88179.1 hypothetical protein KFL_004070010 [Klebsormidium nitens]